MTYNVFGGTLNFVQLQLNYYIFTARRYASAAFAMALCLCVSVCLCLGPPLVGVVLKQLSGLN